MVALKSIITPPSARCAPSHWAERISCSQGSDAGGDRAAAFYSLIGTAKLNGLDPEAYLREVFTRIADHPINGIEELLPWNLAPSMLDGIKVAA